MREALLITGSDIVNVVVIPDGKKGDAALKQLVTRYDAVIEVTDSDPKPGLGLGWAWDGTDLLPPPPDPEAAE